MFFTFELFLARLWLRLVQVDREDMDGVAVTAAGQPLGSLVNTYAVDVGLFFASSQFLEGLA